MNKEEKIKKEWELVTKIVDVINRYQQKWGNFGLWLRDNSIIYGSAFLVAYYSDTYFIELYDNQTKYARINVKSIKAILPEYFVIEQIESDKNDK